MSVSPYSSTYLVPAYFSPCRGRFEQGCKDDADTDDPCLTVYGYTVSLVREKSQPHAVHRADAQRAEKTKSCIHVSKRSQIVVLCWWTYVVSSGNSDTVLKGVPAHMQYLLVEIDLICIRLLPHSGPLSSSRRTSSTGALLCAVRTRAVDRCRHPDLLRFEGALVRLQYNLCLLLGVGWVDHEVVVVGTCHDV